MKKTSRNPFGIIDGVDSDMFLGVMLAVGSDVQTLASDERSTGMS